MSTDRELCGNEQIKFFTYEAFTEATRQVKKISAELQEHFAKEREERQRYKNDQDHQ